jgi:hypothetical protein
MRIAQVIVVGSLAALVGIATPASAKKVDGRKSAEEKSTSSSCHTYQQAADGTWIEHPCEEVGGSTQPRPVRKSQEEEPR